MAERSEQSMCGKFANFNQLGVTPDMIGDNYSILFPISHFDSYVPRTDIETTSHNLEINNL